MEHAEAHELLADLALEPAKLRSLHADTATPADRPDVDPALGELRRHIAACERCLADVDGWLRTWSAVGDARPSDTEADEWDAKHALVPPDRLRARTLAAIRTSGPRHRPAMLAADAARGLGRLLGARAVRGLLAAAAVLALVFAGAVAIQSRADLQRAQSQQSELAATTAALERILAGPSHHVLALHAADGSTGGTLAWSDKEFVVLTSSLSAPATGQEYRCWVQVNGTRTPLGPLSFSDRVASWSGSMAGWEWDFVPGAQFGVSLHGGDGISASPVLVGTIE